MAPALLTAFSTASSSATLPLTMDCIRKRAGVSNKITSFTLPLGATINMDGTALFECVVVVFLAQLFGVEMGFRDAIHGCADGTSYFDWCGRYSICQSGCNHRNSSGGRIPA